MADELIEYVSKQTLDYTIENLSKVIYDFILEKLLSDPEALFEGATEDSIGKSGLLPTPTETSYIGIFKGATANSDGTAGLVPPPSYQE